MKVDELLEFFPVDQKIQIDLQVGKAHWSQFSKLGNEEIFDCRVLRDGTLLIRTRKFVEADFFHGPDFSTASSSTCD